jgi:electron transfer flavoprotein alpha subunit
MQTTDTRTTDARRFYALIPPREGDGANDFAPMALARQLADRHGGEAHALLCGHAPAAALARARELGLDHAWLIAAGSDAPQPHQLAEHAPQPHQLAERYAAALRTPGLGAGLDRALLLVATRPDNEELAGRLAACLGAAPLGRCQEFDIDAAGTLHARRAAYGGRLDAVVCCAAGPAIASVRGAQSASSATLASDNGTPRDQAADDETAGKHRGGEQNTRAALEVHTLDDIPASLPGYAITALPRAEPHAGLDGARLVVSGGRGIGGDQGFPLLYQLADKLGGAVGASLPAVDAGWAPVARQVGQSGRYVSPEIYLAIGISGTPQHLAGIDPHTRIVAVNRDAEAPIFNAAQIGVVAEWQTLLPALLTVLEETS